MLHPTPEKTPPEAITPFWRRLNTFFAFPLQRQPLAYGAVLALASLLYPLLAILPRAGAILVVELGILLAASRYGFKVTAMGSRGLRRVADFPRHMDEDWPSLPWKLFAIFVLQGMAVVGLARVSTALGEIAWLAASFLLPATVILLVQTCSLTASLNPLAAAVVVQTVGWPYLLLCFFLFLLSQGAVIAFTLLAPIFNGWVLLPLANWLLIYFGWVMCSLLGYVMYQHHADFGTDLLPGGGDDATAHADRRTPEQIAQDLVDAQVAQQITDGDLTGALATAYEDQRRQHAALRPQRRYHRVLALSDKPDTLLDHARRFIPLLLGAGHASEALKAYRTCRERNAQFTLDHAGHTLELATAAWKGGDARETIALLNGFDRRFKGDALVPSAYELAARALVDGLGRPDMALKVLATLQARHADSPATQEVQWLLRAHLPKAPSSSLSPAPAPAPAAGTLPSAP